MEIVVGETEGIINQGATLQGEREPGNQPKYLTDIQISPISFQTQVGPQAVTAMSFAFPLVALEEHFFAKSVAEQYEAAGEIGSYTMFPKPVQEKLLDLGDVRLSAMNRGQTAVQIISHAPNRLALTPETCRKANDELHAAVQKHPDRFGAFATLPMAYPHEAAAELKRCVKELGFVGSLVDNNTEGRFYDSPFFWPIFEAHCALDVPCYIHPTYHYDAMDVLYRGNYPEKIAESLALHGFGWHSECALHILRLFAAKVFDEYPKLKVIIGHMGEM